VALDTYLREVAGKYQTWLRAISSSKQESEDHLPMALTTSGKIPAMRNSVFSLIRG
jgi:hypothetical protein